MIRSEIMSEREQTIYDKIVYPYVYMDCHMKGIFCVVIEEELDANEIK